MKTITTIPKDKPWLDYSSLAMLTKCPRKYYWRIIREITSSSEKVALINGEAYHESKATYLKLMKAGHDHDFAKRKGLEALVPIMSQIKTEDKKRNLSVALATMDNYFEFWKGEEYRIIDVEIRFAVDMINFLYVGRIDAYKEHQIFGKLVEETKTTSIVGDRWQLRTKPNLQIDGYVAGIYLSTGEMPGGGLLDVIPVTEKLNQKPFRFIAPRSLQDVEDWTSNIQEWWFTLSRYKEHGIFPQNTEECIPLIGYNCEFQTLCTLFPHPHKMEEIDLPGEYKIESWTPFDELSKIEKPIIREDIWLKSFPMGL